MIQYILFLYLPSSFDDGAMLTLLLLLLCSHPLSIPYVFLYLLHYPPMADISLTLSPNSMHFPLYYLP